jgi:hypothetical protein
MFFLPSFPRSHPQEDGEKGSISAGKERGITIFLVEYSRESIPFDFSVLSVSFSERSERVRKMVFFM